MRKLFLVILCLSATVSYAQSWFWKVSGNGLKKPSYIFGTMHMICKEDMSWPAGLDNAISNSEVMIQENLEVNDPKKIMAVMALARMKDGKTLYNFLDSSEVNEIKSFYADSLDMPFIFSAFKPILATAPIILYFMQCREMLMMEELLLEKAKADSLQLDQLESMQEQMSFLDSIPYENQAKELLSTIREPEKARKENQEMIKMYQSGNLDGLDKFMNNYASRIHQLENVLINDRNYRWTGILDKRMKEQSLFVAVGAAHLPGEKGLVQLLRAKGYTLTPVK